jgi:hypothetical protein
LEEKREESVKGMRGRGEKGRRRRGRRWGRRTE